MEECLNIRDEKELCIVFKASLHMYHSISDILFIYLLTF